MQDRVGIFFSKTRKKLVSIYGEYLGSELHRIVVNREQLDRRLKIPIKSYYTFRLSYTGEGKGWLMVG